METWKPIPSMPNYEASSEGRVRRAAPGKRTKVGNVLRQQPNGFGYYTVWLTHDGVQVKHRVHRLVCEAFNGPAPENKPWALHGDGDRSNNVPGNLRWGDRRDNGRDMVKHGRVGEKTNSAKLTAYDVVAIRAASEAGRDRRVLAQQFDINPVTVWCILKRKTWKHIT